MLFTNSIKFPDIFNLYYGETSVDSEFISINRCLGLLLTTAKGELLGDPDFGCTLYEKLLSSYTSDCADSIKQDIIEAIEKYEKRVTVNNTDINIEESSDEPGRYKIHINYKLKNSDLTNDAYIDISREDN